MKLILSGRNVILRVVKFFGEIYASYRNVTHRRILRKVRQGPQSQGSTGKVTFKGTFINTNLYIG